MELLTDKVIYHTETQEDYDDLMEKLEKLGCKWVYTETCTSVNHFPKCGENTAIKVGKKMLSYSPLSYYVEYINTTYKSYQIIKYKKEQNPMKVKLTADQRFIADWYEEHKDAFEFSIYYLLSDYRLLSSKEFIVRYGGKMLDWTGDSGNKPVQILVKMHLFGYEIEREPLYYVAIPNPNSAAELKDYHLAKTTDGRVVIQKRNTTELKDNWKLTESEIKQDFEWAWQFAKEV